MAINTYLSVIESKKQNKQTSKQTQNHRHREHFDGCQMGGSLGGQAKKGINKYKLVVT